MTASTAAVQIIVSDVLREEGGWVDNPHDKGGPTNRGVTLPELSEYYGRPATVEELKALDDATASDLYTKLYVEKPGFDAIDDFDVLNLTVDSAVNHGQSRVAKWLQAAVRVPVDGDFGPVSAEAVNNVPAREMYCALLAARARFYGQIVTADSTQAVFDAGWMNRLAYFIERVP